MKTREQEYAGTIYTQVERVKGKPKQFRDEYKTAAKNLAFLIRSAGLVQALFFTYTRNNASETLINDLVVAVQKSRLDLSKTEQETLTNNFLNAVRNEDLLKYIYLTEKCLLALKWYKRCVDIHLKDDKQQNSNEVENDDDNKA